ncbi:hypothetical protein N5C46_22300 [Rossellomorea vietnamensis]|uniref:Uncharacterized protein n=1 Tax=Rossellomorea vietnamensis TaxID=218284 RepID=A0ACD4C6N2_9BACI|nr:hypothetical protein [Rossellomorea vietnamensis]UXH44325.1 hypothetical protein N5C46_22300 [Rossellomorea vietnamensis]
MKNDLCTRENAECAMGREGYCLTKQKGGGEMFLNIVIWSAFFHRKKTRELK